MDSFIPQNTGEDRISFLSKAFVREKPLTNFYSYMGIEFISLKLKLLGKNLF